MKGGISLNDLRIPMTNEEQCAELAQTVKCKIAPSAVHGVGVFAMRDIKKGEKCYCALTVKPNWYTVKYDKLKKYLTPARPEVLQLIMDRWPQVYNGSQFISPNYDARLCSFMNHADKPNYEPVSDLALEDIKAGEELFEDYRVINRYEEIYPWLHPVS